MTLLRYALKGTDKTPDVLSPLALFSLLGNRGFGAYRFEPHGYPELDLSEPIDIGRLARYAGNVCQENGKELTENRLRELLRSGLFTIGSWPESLLAVNDYTGEVRSGQADIPAGFEGWTLKLDGVKPTGGTALTDEYENYLKAVTCGLDMIPCRQIKEGNHTHLLIKRVDRMKQEKIHVQSFAALRDEPSDTCEAVFRCMRLLHLSYPELVNYYKRVVFNVLIGNKQEIARDILFTCQGDNEWHLAPASRLHQPSRPHEQTLSVCGKQENQTLEDVLILGKTQGIRKCADLVARIQSFFNAVTYT
jgi:serine/threonine-protein kinase HipA